MNHDLPEISLGQDLGCFKAERSPVTFTQQLTMLQAGEKDPGSKQSDCIPSVSWANSEAVVGHECTEDTNREFSKDPLDPRYRRITE